MKTTTTSRFRARTHGWIVVAAALVSPGLALADLPSPHELHREVREHVHDVLRHLERVPDHIERAHERQLQVFFGGREYHRPHRHEHVTYHFPVRIDGHISYRPYSYCDGRLIGSARPQLWIDWGRTDAGSWCDRCRGHFPRNHGHFDHDRSRRDHYDRREYRHDRREYRDDRRHDRRREWRDDRCDRCERGRCDTDHRRHNHRKPRRW